MSIVESVASTNLMTTTVRLHLNRPVTATDLAQQRARVVAQFRRDFEVWPDEVDQTVDGVNPYQKQEV